ncbi:MAG: xanthine dehydrogenase molybdopterin binding subunit [Phycisphaerae bacterium]|nr:xanthine dehydrogenase molybdopterin binding subunit [Phycisphaerae bacterium]MDW8262575.1 xanthine dehydrogenase molybdopterin binding subunit [Phycisphaerales bacterium]
MSYVGRDIPLDSARGHATGESIFLDDVPPLPGELFVGMVGSPVARGRVKRLELEAVRQLPGVAGVFTARDVPGHNRFGPVVKDEDLLVDEEAQFIGHPVVLIAAESRPVLERAKRLVRLEMQELEPVLSIDRAIELGQFLSAPRKIERGEVDRALSECEHTLEGVFELAGQEHFYLESQISIVIPGENDTYTVHSSTQHTSEVQALVAEVLGIPFSHVTCICRRMGGGFGGKETQAAQPAMMAAIVAHHLRRPARFAYSKDEDMRFTGKRHPFKIFWKAGFDSSAKLHAVDLRLFSDGGFSTDLSLAVMERALLHCDNAYYIEHFRAVGRVCRTNFPSNTAFRGFGGPQGVAAIENVIEEIARQTHRDALDIRQQNVYRDGRDVTPYGQRVGNNTLPQLFATLRQQCSYDERRRQIARFNSQSQTHLRGLAMTAVKFGISFTRKALNQANALVNLYLDGSVVVSTGATEMGQGVNTRIRQIVSDELGVSYEKVVVAPTSTEKNNNTSPTAASSGTDLNGNAAIDACQRLRRRLLEVAKPLLSEKLGFDVPIERITIDQNLVFDQSKPQEPIDLAIVLQQAYEQRISLGERGFYFTPDIDFDRNSGRGTPFYYFTNGVACSEVLIDRFTGELRVTRVDLLMDIGRSINPGIDRGQITGGFIQGMGWVTTEQLMYSPTGQLWSHSPTTYKIPNLSDLPAVFNVSLLPNDGCLQSIRRAKAVGEPPLLLGFSVFAAVKDALRQASGGKRIDLSLPATNERIALALQQAILAPPPAPQPAPSRQDPAVVASSQVP